MAQRFIIFFLLTLFFLQVHARHAGTERYYFKHYDSSTGLSQNTVNCMLQDRNGFIWMGTKDGLNRFDGTSFKQFGHRGNIYCSLVNTILEDKEGLIWIGTHEGAGVYNPSTEAIEKFDIRDEKGHSIDKQVMDFCQDVNGNILIAVDNDGVYTYDRKTRHLTLSLDQKKVGSRSINRIEQAPDGRIWLGTFGNGLYYSDDNMKSAHRFISKGEQDRLKGSIISALKIHNGKVYVATENMGLHSIDIANGNTATVFSADDSGDTPFIRDIIFDGNRQIWIGSESGIYICDMATGEEISHITHNYYDNYSISDNAIYSLLCDRQGGVWIGSYFGGVDYLDRKRMRFDKYYGDNTPVSLNAQRIRELCTDIDGMIYVATEDNGVYAYNPSTGAFSRLAGIRESNIQCLRIDGDCLWAGGFSSGLTVKKLRGGTDRHYSYLDGGLNSNFVFSICRTMAGDMYVGTYSGLQRYDRENDRFISENVFNDIFVYDIFEDSAGNLWVATYNKGLYMRRAGSGEWERFVNKAGDSHSIPSNKVYGVSEDSDHNVWVVTQNGPCVYLSGDSAFSRTFKGIDRIEGVVFRMVNDSYGRYWLSSNRGLYCLDTDGTTWHHFTVADGLPTNQFNYNSSLVTSDGLVYMGTIEGLISFDPGHFRVLPVKNDTRPVLADIMVGGEAVVPGAEGSSLDRSVTMADVINLKGRGEALALKIVSLDYSLPKDTKVKYRLRGVDGEWRYLPLGGWISYPNLDYGNYRLEYAICDSVSDNEEGIHTIDIVVKTPFYRSVWAIIFYVAATMIFIWLAFRHYRRYSRLSNQRYLEHFTREKEKEAYDSKISFFTNVAHEIRTPLSLIKAPLDCVFQSNAVNGDPEVRENLDVINMNVDRLLLLANQLLDFRRIEDGKFQIHKKESDIRQLFGEIMKRFSPTIASSGKRLRLDVPSYEVKATVDSEAITKIISNLLTNAIKYGETYINVSLTADGDRFTVAIANDGNRIPPSEREHIFSLFSRLESGCRKTGAGIGLAYARSLAQMHGGSLTMGESEQENVFILNIPTDGGPHSVSDEEKKTEALEYIVKRNEGGVTVLIVDDNPEMLSFLEKKFISANYNVRKASNGKDALDVLHSEYIDIVVSDVMMPLMDGFELLRKIKEDIDTSHIPVVLLTAKTRMEDKLSGIDAGAEAYIEKPFTLEYLLATIGTILRNREMMRRRLESLPLAKVSEKGLSKVDEGFLQKINDLIQANFNNPDFSMEDVIDALGMSRTTFYRKIKGLLDLNPNEYIRMERLRRAAALFSEGHTAISEVCYMVGFSSPGYFTKCFQKQFGVSPKEYIASLASRQDGKNVPNM